MHRICSNIWETSKWPEIWTKSIIVTIPKKDNLTQCTNYLTISLINHASKSMLKIFKNRLDTQLEQILSEKQAGFRKNRSTIEKILNLWFICEKHNLFIDFRKAFDRVWQKGLWSSMHKFNIDRKLIDIIKNLYDKASSVILRKGVIGEEFPTKTGVRQECLLSPTLFNLFLEDIMQNALCCRNGTIKMNGRLITNLRFADDIDGLAGS